MLDKNYINLLKEFVSYKSISTDSAYKKDIQKTVDWLQGLFKDAGFETETYSGKTCNPVVYANYKLNPKAKTVLVYGHYDVQPAQKEDGWDSDPFTLTESSNRLIARGVVDNKGQVLTHIYTVIKLIKEGKLAYNVKFLVEGNEETANEDMPAIVKKHKAKLKANHIVVSDGEIAGDSPVIEYSLRGGFNTKLTYISGKNNLHTGIYGGTVPNAAYELSKFISKLYDPQGKIAIPGFYNDVDAVTKEQEAANKKLVSSNKSIQELAGVKKLYLGKGENFYTKACLMPTIEITGIKSGYIGEGYANIIPCQAEVRVNFRTVRSQNMPKLIENYQKFIKKHTPDFIDYKFEHTEPYKAIKIDINSAIVKKVQALLGIAYGTPALVKPVGGGIPVVCDFKDELGVDSMLISLGNEDCNMHGVNENFRIDLLEKGVAFSEMFFTGQAE